MANAVFYNTSKRQNSTLVPSGAGVTLDVLLKDDTSFLNPVLRLSYAGIPAFSMCQFGGRYYFIDDIVSVHNNLWDVYCRVDVLATWKSAILATTAFVLYDETANTDIVDGRLPIQTDETVSVNNITYFSPYYSATGCYLLTAVNRDGCFTYTMSEGELTQFLNGLINFINGHITGATVEDAVTEVGKMLIGSGNVMDNIKGLCWVPFNSSDLGSVSRILAVGLYDNNDTCTYVTGLANISWTQRINIPWQTTGWRRTQPYTQVYVYIPYIGTVMIPAGNITQESALDVRFSINKRNGAMGVDIYGAASGERVYTGSGSTAVSIPIGASALNAGALVTGGIAVAANLLTGNVLGAAANAFNSVQSNPQSAGGIAGGAGSGLTQDLICFTVFHNVSDTPANMELGTPTFKTKSLGTLSGYVQCDNASVAGAMTQQERNEINTLLNGGIYIE